MIRVPPAGVELLLEHGITVRVDFRSSDFGGVKAGDYWVFAARTADATVEHLDRAPPRGIHHHFARLATFPSGDFYLARLTRLAGNRIELAIDARLAGVISTLARFESAGLDGLQTFDVTLRATGPSLRANLNGRAVIETSHTSILSGSVGLFADGAGVAFEEFLVASL